MTRRSLFQWCAFMLQHPNWALLSMLALTAAILLFCNGACHAHFHYHADANVPVLVEIDDDSVDESDPEDTGREQDVPGDDSGRTPRDFLELWPG